MKLKLNRTLRAALIAIAASVSFTTLSTGTLAVAAGAALLAGQQAQAKVVGTATANSVVVQDTTYTSTTENGVYVVYGNNEDSTSFTLGEGVTAEYVLITSTDNNTTPNKGRYLIDSNAATRMANYGTIILAEGTVDGKTYKGGQIFLRENITVRNDLILGTCGYEEPNGWAGSIRMSSGDKFTGKVEFVQSTTLVVGGNATFSGTVSSGDDVTVTLMKANTLTFSNGGHTNIHKVVLQESNLTINQTEQSGDMDKLYTGTVEVKGSRTLTLTPKSTANQNDRNSAPKFDGDVILSGTGSNSKAQLTYTDGSTYITGAVDMGTGGYGRMVNSWDKQQHINALKGTNATLELVRNNGSSGKGGYFNLYTAGGFTGTVKLQNSSQDLRSGLIVHDAPTAVAGAVMDFSANNKALLAFIEGTGNYDGDKLLTDNNTWTAGTVAGLTGSNGSVKAATLTIDTANETAYTYGGDLGVSSLVKNGTGSQTISTAVSMTGDVNVNAGTLVLGSSLTSATLSVAQDATLKLAGSNTLTISGSLTLAEGAMLDAANIAYSESPVVLGTVGSFAGTGAIVTNVAAGYKGELSVGDSNNLLLTFVQVGGEMAWHGTQDSHNWNNNVWNDNVNFVAGSIADFAAGAHAVVDITDAQSANKVNVGGQTYTFNLAEGGSLSANFLNVTSNSLEIVLNGGSLAPGDITIEQDASLTISGTGSLTIGNISGAGAFVKADTSTITLNQALSGFNGTIAVNAGTLVAAADNTLGTGVSVGSAGTLVLGVHTGMPTINGSGTVKITDGNFQYNDNASYLEGFSGKVLIANGGLVQIGNHASKFAAASSLEIGTGGTLKGWGANFTKGIVLSGGTLADAGNNETYSGAINVTANSTVDASNGHTVTLSGALTGTGELKKAGSGTLTLSGANTGYAGGLYADAGTVNITTDTTLATLRVGSGTLNIKADTTVNGTLTIGPENGHYNGTLVVDANKTLSVATIAAPWGFNAITVNGTLTVRDGGQVSITSNQNNKFVSGAGVINTPQLNIGNASTVGKFSGGLTINIGNGGITGGRPVEFQDVTVSVLDGSNGWSAANAITLAAASGKATTFNIGEGKMVSLTGAVSGSGSLVKTGLGTLKLTGANTATGGVTVSAGALALGANNMSLSSITLQQGTTLNTDNGNGNNLAGITVSTLNVLGNATITKKDTWSTQMNIGVLNGTGNLLVDFGTDNNSSASVLKLTGSGDYSGELTLSSNYKHDGTPGQPGNYWGYQYVTMLQVDNADALAHAVVNLEGYEGTKRSGSTKYNDNATLAIKADTMNVAGLKGNEYSYIYSGQATASESAAPTGDGIVRTLHITLAPESECAYAGTVAANVNLIIDGGGTQTFNGNMSAFNGSLTLTAGHLVLNSELGDSAVISVQGDATISGTGIDAKDVGIAADKTATFADGITLDNGVSFSKEGGVQVKNTNAVGGDTIQYGIGEEKAKVTADRLAVESETAVTVKNEVVVSDIANLSTGTLTLAHVNAEPLQGVYAHDGALTLQNITEVSLVEMEIASGSTVAVYTSENAEVEGTVAIADTLTAGGGTLLANLTLVDDSTLNLSLVGGGMQALTLGSTLTFDLQDGLVNLDSETIAALNNLGNGESLNLIVAAQGTGLSYTGAQTGMWYNDLFNRVDGLEGDYTVYANEGAFGLTKFSQVPEPTTGTLSLLALAGLCARRRRK